MAFSKIANASLATVSFTYGADLNKASDTLANAAYYLHEHGLSSISSLATVSDMTNAQIGGTCDFYIKRMLKDAAKTFHVTKLTDFSRATGTTYADKNLSFQR